MKWIGMLRPHRSGSGCKPVWHFSTFLDSPEHGAEPAISVIKAEFSCNRPCILKGNLSINKDAYRPSPT